MNSFELRGQTFLASRIWTVTLNERKKCVSIQYTDFDALQLYDTYTIGDLTNQEIVLLHQYRNELTKELNND